MRNTKNEVRWPRVRNTKNEVRWPRVRNTCRTILIREVGSIALPAQGRQYTFNIGLKHLIFFQIDRKGISTLPLNLINNFVHLWFSSDKHGGHNQSIETLSPLNNILPGSLGGHKPKLDYKNNDISH